MLPTLDWTAVVVAMLLFPWIVRFVLGLVIVFRAKSEDLPKIAGKLIGWFRPNRRRR